jgi:hypothetical protein
MSEPADDSARRDLLAVRRGAEFPRPLLAVARLTEQRGRPLHKALSEKWGPQTRRNPLASQNEKLRRQNQPLREELEKAHIVQKLAKLVTAHTGCLRKCE